MTTRNDNVWHWHRNAPCINYLPFANKGWCLSYLEEIKTNLWDQSMSKRPRLLVHTNNILTTWRDLSTILRCQHYLISFDGMFHTFVWSSNNMMLKSVSLCSKISQILNSIWWNILPHTWEAKRRRVVWRPQQAEANFSTTAILTIYTSNHGNSSVKATSCYYDTTFLPLVHLSTRIFIDHGHIHLWKLNGN